jgi:hypothetical protein
MTSQKIKVQTIWFVQNGNQFQKDDTDEDFDFQFVFAFELDFESFVALDHSSQLRKFKSFFAKLEENEISAKTVKPFCPKK